MNLNIEVIIINLLKEQDLTGGDILKHLDTNIKKYKLQKILRLLVEEKKIYKITKGPKSHIYSLDNPIKKPIDRIYYLNKKIYDLKKKIYNLELKLWLINNNKM